MIANAPSEGRRMKWASRVSDQINLRDAMDECVAHVRAELGDVEPDLALVFVSPHHTPDFDDIPALLRKKLNPRTIIGCSGGGVIGGGREVEDRAGFALTAAMLPETELVPFHLEDGQLPTPDAGPSEWEAIVGVTADQSPDFVILPDPFTIRGEDLLAGLDYAFPGRVKVGGLASGSPRGGGNVLYANDAVHHSGAVGLAIHGNILVETIVAQGCRPIGQPVVVTKCNQNVLLELDDRKTLEVLREIFEASKDRDQALINRALHLGVVNDPLKEEFHPGDFLIRNVIGIHKETEGIAVGELLREGQVVQFHVRDAITAEEDLQTMLRQYADGNAPQDESGALLFSCLGRGVHLFGKPDHDTDIFREEVGPLSLGGFFCNGEIGPVGPGTYLHGFTSSFAIFRPR